MSATYLLEGAAPQITPILMSDQRIELVTFAQAARFYATLQNPSPYLEFIALKNLTLTLRRQ
jgi:hypothetical protein